jgi:hypothetical protein
MLARWPLGSYLSPETTFGSSHTQRSPRSSVLFSKVTLPSGSIAAIASNASTLMAMRTLRGYMAAMKASDAVKSPCRRDCALPGRYDAPAFIRSSG